MWTVWKQVLTMSTVWKHVLPCEHCACANMPLPCELCENKFSPCQLCGNMFFILNPDLHHHRTALRPIHHANCVKTNTFYQDRILSLSGWKVPPPNENLQELWPGEQRGIYHFRVLSHKHVKYNQHNQLIYYKETMLDILHNMIYLAGVAVHHSVVSGDTDHRWLYIWLKWFEVATAQPWYNLLLTARMWDINGQCDIAPVASNTLRDW